MRRVIGAGLFVLAGCTGREGPVSGAASVAPTAQAPTAANTVSGDVFMDKSVSIHHWVRSGSSVYVAQITAADVRASGDGQQTTTLEIRIERVLFGARGAEVRAAAIIEPASVTARLKFPPPVWGFTPLTRGTWLLLVTAELGPEVREPAYARAVSGPEDAALAPLRDLLSAESKGEDGRARRARYLTWVRAGSSLERLFAGQAFSEEADLPDVDPKGEVAAAFSAALSSERDPQLKATLLQYAFPGVFDRSNDTGKVALLEALFRAAHDGDADLRRSALDLLSEVPEREAELPGIAKSPEAATFVEERLSEETDGPTKARLRAWLRAVR